MTTENFDQGSEEAGSQGESTGTNPSWAEIEGLLPPEQYSQIQPVLQKWDAGVTQRFQEVQSKYDPYKPFVERGIGADLLEQGYGLLNAVQNDPQEVIRTIAEWAGISLGEAKEVAKDAGLIDQGQGSQSTEQASSYKLEDDPAYKKLEEQNQTMMQFLIAQKEQEETKIEQQKIAGEFEALEAQRGSKFESEEKTFLLNSMLQGETLEDAYKKYQAVEARILGGQPRAPQVMGGGGSFPSSSFDATKLKDGKETRNAVAEMLRQTNAQKQ